MKEERIKKRRDLQTINTLCSLAQHVVVIICVFILPREILTHYGSEMNGVLRSITQLFSYTVLLEMGIGAVIPTVLYKSLVEGDNQRISAILNSGSSVFRRIGVICIGYTGFLMLIFPALTGVQTSALIFVLGCGIVVLLRLLKGRITSKN